MRHIILYVSFVYFYSVINTKKNKENFRNNKVKDCFPIFSNN